MAAPPTPATAEQPNSPTLSDLTSSSSYIMASAKSLSSTMGRSLHLTEDDSDDEIVWNVSEESLSPAPSENEDSAGSEDGFVLLSRPLSSTGFALSSELPNFIEYGTDEGLHTPLTASISMQDQLQTLSLAPRPFLGKKKKIVKKKETQQPENTTLSDMIQRKKNTKKVSRNIEGAYPSPEPSPRASKAGTFKPSPTQIIHHARETEWFEEMAIVKFTGLGARPVVDDYSDRQSVISCDNESVGNPTIYEEASNFISSFLSNPDAKNDTVCRLTLLQSLIIELGLATASLPESLSAATAFLKSRAFLNIREYLAVRGQGPEAVQRALYPSKSALIKDIKKRRNQASRKWVKQHGLQVLLVGWTHQ